MNLYFLYLFTISTFIRLNTQQHQSLVLVVARDSVLVPPVLWEKWLKTNDEELPQALKPKNQSS